MYLRLRKFKHFKVQSFRLPLEYVTRTHFLSLVQGFWLVFLSTSIEFYCLEINNGPNRSNFTLGSLWNMNKQQCLNKI